jgi:hypothetical protein
MVYISPIKILIVTLVDPSQGGERARFCLHPDWYSYFFFQIEDCLFILHVPEYHTMALLPGTCLPSKIDVRLNIILGPYVYVLDVDQ